MGLLVNVDIWRSTFFCKHSSRWFKNFPLGSNVTYFPAARTLWWLVELVCFDLDYQDFLVKTSYFNFKGWKIQIFPDFWQLFLFLLSKVIQTGFFCLQVIFQSSCNQGKSFWMTFESKNRKSCQKSGKIWIFDPLKKK